MKKTLLTFAVAATTVASFAQGTLNFGNQFSGFIAPIYGPEPGNPAQSISGQSSLGTPTGSTVYTGQLLTGTGFTMQLFAGASSVVDENLLTLVAGSTKTFRTSAATGQVLPKGLVSPGVVTISGFDAGTTPRLQVRVWDNQGGTITSWAEAAANPLVASGKSSLFLSGQLGGTDTGGTIFITPNSIGWASFNIAAVPEPSTFVLAGLGAAGLLIFRRRK